MLDQPGPEQSGLVSHDKRMTIRMRNIPTEDVDTNVNIGQLKKDTQMIHQYLSGEYKPYQYNCKIALVKSKTMENLHHKPNWRYHLDEIS
jgi:hypothetical protein